MKKIRYTMFSGANFVQSSDELHRIKATRSQVTRWIAEMGLNNQPMHELRIVDNHNLGRTIFESNLGEGGKRIFWHGVK